MKQTLAVVVDIAVTFPEASFRPARRSCAKGGIGRIGATVGTPPSSGDPEAFGGLEKARPIPKTVALMHFAATNSVCGLVCIGPLRNC